MVPDDAIEDGAIHLHEVGGPDGASLLLLERSVKQDNTATERWRLMVAADLRETETAVSRFNGVLLGSLAGLLALLCAAAVAQVAVGLAPLRALQRALAAIHEGRSHRLEGRFPDEVQPLIDDFNGVLDRNAEVVNRARTQAGNLAHAIKTPLAAMSQAAAAAMQRPQTAAELAPLVQEQVAVARRHVDWHLARSRAAVAQGVPGARTALAPVINGLLRVMDKVHSARNLAIDCADVEPDLVFAGEVQDLQEILGNLLDNAFKWAREEVRVLASTHGSQGHNRLHIVIDDDGPGIEPSRRAAVMARGARLDETVPGSGLGLAIVNELVDLYGGSVTLGVAPSGGLRVEVELPGSK